MYLYVSSVGVKEIQREMGGGGGEGNGRVQDRGRELRKNEGVREIEG